MNKLERLEIEFNKHKEETETVIAWINESMEDIDDTQRLMFNLNEAKVHIEWLHNLISSAVKQS